MKLLFSILSIFCGTAQAEIEYKDLLLGDGTTIQTCTRYPDNQQFSGPRPAIMLIAGSGLYDSCHAKLIGGDLSDQIAERGVILFLVQKRGLRHDSTSNTFTTDLDRYTQSDFPHLKSDALQAFESLQKSRRVDPSKIAVWGGSEGTVIATHIGLLHPELREIVLISSAIEPFPKLYARQMYELLPRQIIEAFDKNKDGVLHSNEITNPFLLDSGLNSFAKIDLNQNTSLDFHEISEEIKKVISDSLANNKDKFFLSEMGGTVTANWVRSGLNLELQAPQVLQLSIPTYLHHGTADENILVQPVYDLEIDAKKMKKTNLHFRFYEGLGHELTQETTSKIFLDSIDRIAH